MEMEMEQWKLLKKRPREESGSGEGAAQQSVPSAPRVCAESPVLASSACHRLDPLLSEESVQSPSKAQPVPPSNSTNEHSLPVTTIIVAIAPDPVQQAGGGEVDDVEELLMRALEEELETPNGNASAVANAAVFQDVKEDDNYDESEDGEE